MLDLIEQQLQTTPCRLQELDQGYWLVRPHGVNPTEAVLAFERWLIDEFLRDARYLAEATLFA